MLDIIGITPMPSVRQAAAATACGGGVGVYTAECDNATVRAAWAASLPRCGAHQSLDMVDVDVQGSEWEVVRGTIELLPRRCTG